MARNGNAVVYIVLGILATLFLGLGGYYLYLRYSGGSALPTTTYRQSGQPGGQSSTITSGDPQVDGAATQVDSSLNDVDLASSDLNQAINDQAPDFSADLQ